MSQKTKSNRATPAEEDMSMQNEEVLYNLVQSGEWRIDDKGQVWTGRTGSWQRIERRTPHGYLQVRKMIGGKRIHTGAHRLVWLHFNGPIPAGITINHKNGRKSDNHPSNLELATRSENTKHAFLIGLQKSLTGQRHPGAKLTEIQVQEIRNEYAKGNVTQAELALRHKVSFQTISKIVRGDRWRTQMGPVADYTARRRKEEYHRDSQGRFCPAIAGDENSHDKVLSYHG